MKLITEPMIHVIAKTEMCGHGLNTWITESNLASVADTTNTPLNNLWGDVDDDFAGERTIEFAGRHCYRAWEKGRKRSNYITNLIEMGHGSVLEHANITFAMQGISRSLTLELIRHRVGVAISQESQRYVDAKDINFVVPPLTLWVDMQGGASDALGYFEQDCENALDNYMYTQQGFQAALTQHTKDVKAETIYKKRINEAARSLLPNAAETRMVWTANYRILRHFLFLRGGMGADLEIRRLAVALLAHCQEVAPTVFGDLETYTPEDEECFGVPIIRSKQYAN